MLKKAENEESSTTSGRYHVGRILGPPESLRGEILERQESPHHEHQEATIHHDISGARRLLQEELRLPPGEEVSSSFLLSQEAWTSSSAARMMMPSRTSFRMAGQASSSSYSSAPASSAPAADNNSPGAHSPGGAHESALVFVHTILTSALAPGRFCDVSDDEGLNHAGITAAAGASTTRTAIAHDGEEDQAFLQAAVPSVRPSSSSSPTTATASTLHSSQQQDSQFECQQGNEEADSASSSAGGHGYHHDGGYHPYYPPTTLPSSLLAPNPSASHRTRSRASYHLRERRQRRFLDQ